MRISLETTMEPGEMLGMDIVALEFFGQTSATNSQMKRP